MLTFRRSGDVLGATVARIRASFKCRVAFLRDTRELWRVQGGAHRWCASVAARCVTNLKSVPQVTKVPGQLNGPFSLAAW